MKNVLPKPRRLEVLKLAYSSLPAEHPGIKIMQAKIGIHFVWPGMSGHIKHCCKSCSTCQRASKNVVGKAPLQSLPCVGEPFSLVVVDLVGPQPLTARRKSLHAHTLMCLFTKYPEALPLKWVDNESVADGLMELIARHSIPDNILSNQGTEFMSKFTAKLCELLDIRKTKTTPWQSFYPLKVHMT